MPPKIKFAIKGKIWRYPGPAGWFFVTLGKKESNQIKWMEGVKKVGLGYVCVNACIGKTKWKTTLFPTKEGPYLIAIKAPIRKKEKLNEGDSVKISLELE
jgi:Domain of unknown function (DUF1905)